jgi:hypothetical protein
MRIFNNCLNGNIVTNSFNNIKFYRDEVKPHATKLINVSESIVCFDRVFRSSSCSLVLSDNKKGYTMNQRFVNYRIDDKGYYNECSDHIITVNKHIEFSDKWEKLSEKVLAPDFQPTRYVGIEDVKIFRHDDGRIWYTGTGMQSSGNIGIFYGLYDALPYGENELHYDKSCGCEKNWVFLPSSTVSDVAPSVSDVAPSVSDVAPSVSDVAPSPLQMIYKWGPMQIAQVDTSTHTISIVQELPMPLFFQHVRGSTNGTRYKDEVWFVTHLVSYENNPRYYYHMWVVLDIKTHALLRYSAPFSFEGAPIEYCLGLVVDEENVTVVYSVWDRTSHIAVFDKTWVETKLAYQP